MSRYYKANEVDEFLNIVEKGKTKNEKNNRKILL